RYRSAGRVPGDICRSQWINWRDWRRSEADRHLQGVVFAVETIGFVEPVDLGDQLHQDLSIDLVPESGLEPLERVVPVDLVAVGGRYLARSEKAESAGHPPLHTRAVPRFQIPGGCGEILKVGVFPVDIEGLGVDFKMSPGKVKFVPAAAAEKVFVVPAFRQVVIEDVFGQVGTEEGGDAGIERRWGVAG